MHAIRRSNPIREVSQIHDYRYNQLQSDARKHTIKLVHLQATWIKSVDMIVSDLQRTDRT